VADLTAAGLLFPLAMPAELQYSYPEFPDWGDLRPHTQHPAMDWIREMYRRHRRASVTVDLPRDAPSGRTAHASSTVSSR